MSAPARFDVVIPTYDRPDLLVQTVRSAVAQTAPGVRVRVVDNTSGPATADAVATFGDDVEYRRFDEHLPYQRNMTRARDHIDAPHGLVLHDDDLLDAGYAEMALDAFARHPEAGMVVLATRPLADPGATAVPIVSAFRWLRAMGHEPTGTGPAGAEIVLPPGAFDAALAHVPWAVPYWPTVSLERDAYRDAGPYDTDLRILIDVDMWMRVGSQRPVVLIDVVSCSYRFHAGSKTSEFANVDDDSFVHDVLAMHAKEREGRSGYSWTDRQAARWLSFALHRVATKDKAPQQAAYERLGLADRGVPLRDLIHEQLDAQLLWRRVMRPDRGWRGVLADLLMRARIRRLSR